MKKSNIVGVILAVVVLIAVVAILGWFLKSSSPLILQGEVCATGYKASSKIAGRIDSMLVHQGQHVVKGQRLYVLSTPELDAKLRQAEAARRAAEAQDKKAMAGARSEQIASAHNMWQKAEAGLTVARQTYDRVSKLYEQGVVPAQKFDEAKANFEAMQATASAAKAQYDMAKAGTRWEDKAAAAALVEQASSVVSEVDIYRNDAVVVSPVTGEVSTIIAEQGELVGSGYPVVALLDMTDVWMSFNVKETLLDKFTIGREVLAHIPALKRDITLKVDYIAVQADFATWSATRTSGSFDVRTFNVKLRSVGAVEGLRPGMSVLIDYNKI